MTTYPPRYGDDYDCRIYIYYPDAMGTIHVLEVEHGYLLNIRYNVDAFATWSLSLLDKDGRYCPDRQWLDAEQTIPNPWFGVLERYCFSWDDAISYNRVMKAVITEGGVTRTFVGVPTTRAHSMRWPDGAVWTTWAGVDQSHILFREGQSMATVRSSNQSSTQYTTSGIVTVPAPGIHYSAAAIQEICTQYGLACELHNFPTQIPVPLLQRLRSKPIEWIQNLLSCPVGEWYVDCDGPATGPGGTPIGKLHVYVPDDGTMSAVDSWDLDASSTWIVNVEDQYSDPGFSFNRVISTRTQEIAGVIQGSLTPCKEYTQYTVNLGGVRTDVRWHPIIAMNGVFSDYEGWLDGVKVASACQRLVGYGSIGGTPVDVINYNSWGNWSRVDTIKFSWGAPVTYTPTMGSMVQAQNAAYGLIHFTESDPTLQLFGSQTLWEFSDPPAPTASGPGISVQLADGQYQVSVGGQVVGTASNAIEAANIAGSLVGDHPRILEGNPWIPNDNWLRVNAKRNRRRFMRDAEQLRLTMRGLMLALRTATYGLYTNPTMGIFSRQMYMAGVDLMVSPEWEQRSTVATLARYPVGASPVYS